MIASSDDQLPLILPELEDYSPSKTGASPLEKADSWVNVEIDGKKENAKQVLCQAVREAAGISCDISIHIMTKNSPIMNY